MGEKPAEKTYLELLRTEKTADGRPLWASKSHQQRQMSEQDLVYLAKIQAMTEYSDRIYKKNLKLRYRLNCISKEIKLMKRSKRFLCEKLLEYNESIHHHRIDFDANDNEAQLDQTIGEVVHMVMQNPAAIEINTKKKKPEMKKKADCLDMEDSKQHIISIIESVASEGCESLRSRPKPITSAQKIVAGTKSSSSNAHRLDPSDESSSKLGLLRVNYNNLAAARDGPDSGGAQPSPSYDALSTPLREVLKIAQGRKADHGGVADAWLALIQTQGMSPKTSSLSPPASARSRLTACSAPSTTTTTTTAAATTTTQPEPKPEPSEMR